MLLAALLTAIPVFLALSVTNMQNRDNLRRELLQEYQTEVTSRAARADVLLHMLEEALISFPMNNSDLPKVAEAEERDADFWLANQRLLNGINSLNSISGAESTAFLYFPRQDIFYNDRENEELSQYIKEGLDASASGGAALAFAGTASWGVLENEDGGYFFRTLDYNKYAVGMWLSYDSVLQFLNTESGEGLLYRFEKNEANALLDTEEEPQAVKLGKEAKYCLRSALEQADTALLLYLDQELIEGALPGITDGFLLILTVLLLIFAVYLMGSYRWMIGPMEKLRRSMEIIGEGDVAYRLEEPAGSSAEFASVTRQFNAMLDRLDQLSHELYEGKLERQEVELAYLSRQIQPHFMLNTLNTLYNYSESDVATAQEIIRLAAKYYRYVVNVNSRYVQLGQELEHIENYLALQKLRYPKAFTYEIVCGGSLDIIPVPPFLVESFISNAIKYGRTAGEQVHIRIRAEELTRFQVRIRISDTGEGFSEDMLDILETYLKTGDASELGGVGIRNSIQRLRLIYGERASIRFYNQEPKGAVVELRIAVSGQETPDLKN